MHASMPPQLPISDAVAPDLASAVQTGSPENAAVKMQSNSDEKRQISVTKKDATTTSKSAGEAKLTRMTDKIKKGDTLATLLDGHLTEAEIHKLVAQSKKIYPLSRLRVGRPWTMLYSENALIGFEYSIEDHDTLKVKINGSDYKVSRTTIPLVVEETTISGTIDSTIYNELLRNGETKELAKRLANAFSRDVSFINGLRKGDKFQIIVEKKFRNDKFVGYGSILAANIRKQKEMHSAFLHTSKKGESAYYDQNGNPLRKAFLRQPLPFARITSGYTMSRRHPILGYSRPHQAIDYAAPKGTPISAVADGVIAEAAINRSQGRYVRIVHSNGYESIYNHMSKFSAKAKEGARVQQGDVIGHVGSSGYATGPHLCFRMKHQGKLINPLSIKAFPAAPITAQEMRAFKANVASYQAKFVESATRSASLKKKSELSIQ